jgi:hypothetical protein
MASPDPITSAQRAVLAKLAGPLRDGFYLVGGVALAAHLAHRTSRDLDLFATHDPGPLEPDLLEIPGLQIVGRSRGTLELRVDGLPVSVIEYRYPLLAPPAPCAGLAVPVASLDDLASMKLSAITGRGAARDFWDLHTIISHTGRPLPDWLATFQRKYPTEDLGHLVRSLAYFGDARGPLPLGLTPERWQEIQRDFESWVRALVLDPAG